MKKQLATWGSVPGAARVRYDGGGPALAAKQPRPDVRANRCNGVASALRVPELILEDGSYQTIEMSYTVKGKIVSYVSAERGETEELPNDLVDWDATRKWERQHLAADDGQAPAPAIDPELLKEEADRRALTPEVAPDLSLPEEDSVVALDYFQGTPELVPLVQSQGELNHVTSHNILKMALNPRAASHEIEQLKGEESPVQMHVDAPVIFLRIGDDTGIARGGTPFTVDTHGSWRNQDRLAWRLRQ